MFSRDVLRIDAAQVANQIEQALKSQVLTTLRRRGIVVGLSGGIDSSVVTALAARAMGPERVLVLLMPERDSASESAMLGRLLSLRSLASRPISRSSTRFWTPPAATADKTRRFARCSPSIGDGYRFKITLPSILEGNRLNISELTIEAPNGERNTSRMSASAYLQMIAATNFKQRFRKLMEYYHADRLNYAVAGTPNRLEYDQGFFVKQGDGAADVKPIAHLYKSQVFALAEYLGVPEEIRTPPANYRYVLAAADTGRVLLRAALRQDGPVPLRAQPWRRADRGSARRGPDGRTGRARLSRTSIRSGGRRGTCTPDRSSSNRSRRSPPDVRHRRQSSRFARACRRPNSISSARMAGSSAAPWTRRVRTLPRRPRGPRARAPLDHRSRERPAAAVERERHALGRRSTARSSTTSSCATSSKASATASAPAATPK